MKYIIVENNGIEKAIVFSPLLNHCDVCAILSKIVSAGFCYITYCETNGIVVETYGRSESLNIDGRHGETGWGSPDGDLIANAINS